LTAIKAKRRMDSLGLLGQVDETNGTTQVETALTQAVYGSNEFNRLIGHQGNVLAALTSAPMAS
jgi:predicted RNA-binding protein Jag